MKAERKIKPIFHTSAGEPHVTGVNICTSSEAKQTEEPSIEFDKVIKICEKTERINGLKNMAIDFLDLFHKRILIVSAYTIR